MKTTVTRSMILEKAKPEYKTVEVDGWGVVGIRSVGQFKLSRRYSSYMDPKTGNPIPSETSKADIHRVIDQVMIDEETPMFTEGDFQALAELDGAKLKPLYEAIAEFNGETEKNEQAGSSDSKTN